MTVYDDLKRLAAEDVVYLTFSPAVQGPVVPPLAGEGPAAAGAGSTVTFIYRGRLRQTVDGSWVFNSSTGVNGVAGIVLGQGQSSWTSSESPGSGIEVDASVTTGQILITNVVPGELVT
jgi:hypothetical protein